MTFFGIYRGHVLLRVHTTHTHAWESRSSQLNVETFDREKTKGGCTNIHILDIILFVTKIGECYSAPYGLQKLINVNLCSRFLIFNRRNREQQHQTGKKIHGSGQTKKIRTYPFR